MPIQKLQDEFSTDYKVIVNSGDFFDECISRRTVFRSSTECCREAQQDVCSE